MQNVKRSVDIEKVQQNITDDNLCDENDFNFLSWERILRYTKISANFDINDFEWSESEPNTDNDSYDNNSINSVYNRLHESHEIFEDYSCLLLELFQDTIIISLIHNNWFLWILLWVMNFQKRFNIPEMAIETLLKFMKLVLTEIREDFNTFQNLFTRQEMHMVWKTFQTFVPCSKCHKLYEQSEVENFCQGKTLTIMKCHHVEFSNSSCYQLRLC